MESAYEAHFSVRVTKKTSFYVFIYRCTEFLFKLHYNYLNTFHVSALTPTCVSSSKS